MVATEALSSVTDWLKLVRATATTATTATHTSSCKQEDTEASLAQQCALWARLLPPSA